MKKKPIVLVTMALAVGFFAARFSAAESQAQGKGFGVDTYVGLHQLESFVAYLQDTKQTNTLQRFFDYSNVTIASQNSADLGVTVGILQRLRDGRTNEALELLEGRLTTDVSGFVASYKELPASLRQKFSLKPVEYARDYRTKFPYKHRYPEMDKGVAEAFTILDQKSAK